MLLYFRAKS